MKTVLPGLGTRAPEIDSGNDIARLVFLGGGDPFGSVGDNLFESSKDVCLIAISSLDSNDSLTTRRGWSSDREHGECNADKERDLGACRMSSWMDTHLRGGDCSGSRLVAAKQERCGDSVRCGGFALEFTAEVGVIMRCAENGPNFGAEDSTMEAGVSYTERTGIYKFPPSLLCWL